MKAATRGERIKTMINEFQSTPPVKAATPPPKPLPSAARISIHAAREGGDKDTAERQKAIAISIHAAREGGDLCEAADMLEEYISIHAAREGGDGLRTVNCNNT